MSSYQLRMTQEAGLQAANAAGAVLTAVRGVPLAVSERIAASLPIEDLHALGAACILPNAATDEALRPKVVFEMPSQTREELLALRLLLDMTSISITHFTETAGVFRKPGSSERVDALHEELISAGRFARMHERLAEGSCTIHDVNGVLKRTLRDVSIIPAQFLETMEAIMKVGNNGRKLELIQIAMLMPSPAARQILQLLTNQILRPVVENSSVNKMTSSATATCISLTLIDNPPAVEGSEGLMSAARHARVSNEIMCYLIENAPKVFAVPQSFKDAYMDLMATGTGSAFPDRPDAVQKFSKAKFQPNEEILTALRQRLNVADKDKDTCREDLIRALHGYVSLLTGCGAAVDRLDEVYEELATLQADASEARGSSRIKRLASTPRRMLAGMLTPRRKRAAATRMVAPPSLEDAFAEADAEIEMRQTMPSSAPPKAKSAARTPRQPLGSVNSTITGDAIERIGQLESIV